jgi:hypothetical protein
MVTRIKLPERRNISVPTTEIEVPSMYQPSRAAAPKTQKTGAPRRRQAIMEMMPSVPIIFLSHL